MSKIVDLSTGEKATFRDSFTHADELVFSAGKRKGVFERRAIQPDGSVAIERTPDNIDAAIHDTLLVLIDSVEKDGESRKPTDEWLKSLKEPDYEALVVAFAAVRTESRQAIEAGKKNR